jgi:hypothetical protein
MQSSCQNKEDDQRTKAPHENHQNRAFLQQRPKFGQKALFWADQTFVFLPLNSA